jgi:hypothetical protein
VVVVWDGGGQNLSSVLKVPRHCPFVLLVGVSIHRYYGSLILWRWEGGW